MAGYNTGNNKNGGTPNTNAESENQNNKEVVKVAATSPLWGMVICIAIAVIVGLIASLALPGSGAKHFFEVFKISCITYIAIQLAFHLYWAKAQSIEDKGTKKRYQWRSPVVVTEVEVSRLPKRRRR